MWYYAQSGKTFGPVPLEKLKEMAAAGVLKPTDHILPVGSQQWLPASTQPGLFARAASSGGTPQAAPPRQPPASPPSPRPGNPPPVPDDAFASHGPQGPMTWSIESAPGLEADYPHPGGPPPHSDEPSVGRKIGRHFARLFTWNLQKVTVDEDERRFLNTQGVEDATLQRYLCWRHSVLFILVFPIFLLALLNTIDLLTAGLSHYNALGKFLLVLLILFPFALPFTALLALIVWYRPKLSWRLLLLGWVIGTAGPLLMNVFPAYIQFDVDGLLLERIGRAPTEEERRVATMSLRFLFGIGAFALLMIQLPIFGITAVQGTQRACLRLKTLLPQSSIPGLFLAMTSPVYVFLLLPFFVTASQLAASPLLLIGMILLMASPLVYTFSFRRMITPLLGPRDFARIWVLQIIASSIFWIGLVFLMIFAFSVKIPFLNPQALGEVAGGMAPGAAAGHAEPIIERTLIGFTSDHSWFRPWSWRLIRWLLVEFLGRSLFTMILVADLFMRVNSYIWLSSRKVLGSESAQVYDELMERLQTSGRWDPETSQVEWDRK